MFLMDGLLIMFEELGKASILNKPITTEMGARDQQELPTQLRKTVALF